MQKNMGKEIEASTYHLFFAVPCSIAIEGIWDNKVRVEGLGFWMTAQS